MTDFVPVAQSYSWSAWYKFELNVGNEYIAGSNSTVYTFGQYNRFIFSTSSMQVQWYINGILAGSAYTSLPGTNWTHFAFAYDFANKTASCWINGASIFVSPTPNINATASPLPFMVGNRSPIQSGPMLGSIYSFRLFNYSLQNAQVQQIYTLERQPTPAQLIQYPNPPMDVSHTFDVTANGQSLYVWDAMTFSGVSFAFTSAINLSIQYTVGSIRMGRQPSLARPASDADVVQYVAVADQPARQVRSGGERRHTELPVAVHLCRRARDRRARRQRSDRVLRPGWLDVRQHLTDGVDQLLQRHTARHVLGCGSSS